MPTITVIGSLNMDLVIRTPRFPAAGETITGHDFTTVPGGKGANQAVATARQGARVTMVGRVGDDGFGEAMLSSLEREGIDTRYLTAVQGAATGVAVIAVEDSGENTIILAPGANHRLVPADINAAQESIARSDALVMQLEVPLDVVTHAALLAKERRIPVVLNAAPARSLPSELLEAVDYLIVNETEAAQLSERSPSEPQEAAQVLLSRGPRNVIVTLGEQGALFTEGAAIVPVPGFKVRAVDTTAAGDAFVGAFVWALTAGKGLREAVVWANAAGALAATTPGAQPSLPTYEAVAGFLEQQGYSPRNH